MSKLADRLHRMASFGGLFTFCTFSYLSDEINLPRELHLHLPLFVAGIVVVVVANLTKVTKQANQVIKLRYLDGVPRLRSIRTPIERPHGSPLRHARSRRIIKDTGPLFRDLRRP
ncbi:hypothetical protein CH63R_09140 [Colletotrichum higginsianum IMI 349063]|uniref:Uncharacterized protein n=1 Tax=Colletotrichum higginsianum (strain IMI 349063) TaxID=759273 RepID=A0A1B7Y6I4_COLHI|nr:hypothetical protein CH63R_09140 [Colletotrichum higginsianum IMI 349063]OBR07619.1 hypothetical protein CH63R_09140 [Colletotrichum higginsianum IMI 349063]